MSFKRFDTQDIVVSSDSITGTAWSTGNPTLTSFFTSSVQVNGSSGDFYVSVFQVDPNLSASLSNILDSNISNIVCRNGFLNIRDVIIFF